MTVVSGGGPGDPLDLKQDVDMNRKPIPHMTRNQIPNITKKPIQLNSGDSNRKGGDRMIGNLRICKSSVIR